MQRQARPCAVCGSSSPETLPKLSHPDWTTVKCKSCGFVYLNEAPDYETLSVDLAWTKSFAAEKKRRKAKAPVLQWLDDKTRWRLHIHRDDEWAYISERVSAGNVLDVGCGTHNRIPLHFTPFGIEIEQDAAIACDVEMRARGGRVVHAPALEGLSQFDDASLDGVIMRSYLEHEMLPREVLTVCHAKLKPGGVIYVKVPNFATLNRMVRGVDWCGFRFPDHLNYFEPKSMRALAEATGFRMSIRNKATLYTNDNLHCFLEKQAA